MFQDKLQKLIEKFGIISNGQSKRKLTIIKKVKLLELLDNFSYTFENSLVQAKTPIVKFSLIHRTFHKAILAESGSSSYSCTLRLLLSQSYRNSLLHFLSASGNILVMSF